ncbi:MAG: hypothetical protein KJO07_08200, partial [Deltaproteobacteria bacterium]|nr:hypothetical protein [Deltaproteobacteria bacterium]
LRVGIGSFGAKRWQLAPRIATYAFGGARLAGPNHRPLVRTGVGLSIPALFPLAEIGIPTMVEGGVDYGGGGLREASGFVRAGWNF